MNTKGDKKSIDVKRTAAIYNMVVNLCWSALSLVPLTVFCYTKLDLNLFLLFLACSLVPVFLPNPLINQLRLANRAATYKKLGVALVQRFSQNGIIVNRLVRKRHPGYKVVQWDQQSIKRLLNQTYMFEKFHWMLFVFFSLTAFYAFWKGLAGWTVFLSLANLFYNIYPILLQQYIRMKLTIYKKRNQHVLPSPNKGFAEFREKCFG